MTEVDGRQVALARHYLEVDQPRRVLDILGGGDVDLDDPDVWALRAEALYQLDRYDDGAQAARDGLVRDPEDLTLLDVLAMCESERGNLAQAERALLAALELWPEHPTLLCHYGLLCAKGDQPEKAYRLVAEAARIAPEAVEVLRTRAQISYLSGDRKRTERDVSALLAADPEDRVAHVLRGNALVDRSDVYGAVRHFEQAARLDPSDEDVVHVTRFNRVLTHPLQWPVYPIQRFGALKVWAVYIVVLLLATATGRWWIAAPIAGIYLFMVVYSWTISPLASWWMRRRMR